MEKGADPFWLFDRSSMEHPWAKAFEETRTVDPERHWAVAANWRMDHRVSSERETGDLLAFRQFASVSSADSWRQALDRYFRSEVCQPGFAPSGIKTSSYSRFTNAGNLIPTKVAGFDRLVHVGSLNTILGRLARRTGESSLDIELRDITGGMGLPARAVGTIDPAGFNPRVSELARALLRQGPDAVRQAAGLLANALGQTEPPWWACYEEEVEGILDSGDAENLCAALGLGHLETGHWLLVWVYRVDEVQPLYRPTVVEAKMSPYHFPSPPVYTAGITMPLKPDLPACREVLHRPLRGALAEERCTGEILLLQTSLGQDSERLADLRAGHWDRLRKEFYTDALEVWAERHPEPK